MNYTVVFEGDSGNTVSQAADRLRELGYHAYFEDTLTEELLDSVNTFRRTNSLRTSDYLDPATLRALGIEAVGDELVFAANCAYSISDTEVGCYDICCEIAHESRTLGLTLTEAAKRRLHGTLSPDPPPAFALAAMVLALLNE